MSSFSTKDLAKKLGCVRKVSHADSSAAKSSVYTSEVTQPISYLFVLDFEATCWDKNSYSFGKNEIIEFPAVILDVKSGLVVDEFQKFVKPTENPILSDFCTSLTGIKQLITS